MTIRLLSSLCFALICPFVQAQKNYTELDCMVKPEMYINLASPVDGVLSEVLVKKSDAVIKGQALARLNSEVEEANIRVAEQEARLDNVIKGKQLQFQYAQRRLQRIGDLFKAKASSNQNYDDAVIEADLAKNELRQAKLDRERNELRLKLAQAQLEQKIIRSPIDGIVVERYLMPGESVENRPILQLAKIDPLQVEVLAPAHIFGQITKDMDVTIRPDFPVDSEFPASVQVIDRIIDAASGTFTILLELPNPDAKLVGGTRCTARFPITSTLKANNSSAADDDLPPELRALLKQ
ncbi:efflux RND transporter periplasmic adaptor subunit [Halioxenophilus aromaticivorans]